MKLRFEAKFSRDVWEFPNLNADSLVKAALSLARFRWNRFAGSERTHIVMATRDILKAAGREVFVPYECDHGQMTMERDNE